MKNSLLPFFTALVAFSASTLSAAEPVTLTLADFTDANGAKPGPGWVSDGGVIHRKAKEGDLISIKEFTSFEVEWEWKVAVGGNSGLKYWVNRIGNAWFGVEYQMLDDANHPDARRGENHTTASIYDIKAAARDKPVKPAGEWNSSKVIVRNGRIQHFLNGRPVVEADTKGDEWKQSVSNSKFKSVDGFAPGHGRFLLQDHGDEVWFRNIRVTPL